MNKIQLLLIGFGLGVVMVLGGCSGSAAYNGHEYAFDGSGVDRTLMIEAIREVLTDHRFEIDRVDGRRGVVTTAFKTTQGIASPWDGEQGSIKQEAADFVNQHERAVRVTIDEAGEVVVSVMVQRVHRPGWRIESESIARSSRTTVIGVDGRREPGRTVTPIGLDGGLAQRIGEEITARLTVQSSMSG